MSDVAIRAEGLGKRYRIGETQTYKALRDTLTDILHAPVRMVSSLRNGRLSASSPESSDSTIWAVKDVSFEVRQGEAVGIIGRNGAGKSTLLKLLSRITEPTEGRAEIRGRVGSLLEVGTGFHPELTGRENVYLNGAILGMRKREIDRKFDEIVDFAEVEKFIDTPVKHYSSGMYLRLAFAVAAHLEREILLVDEVLAVGDAAFQKKCLGKMGEVAQEGRTVLFVSHNIGAVTQLCPSAILLNQGSVAATGPSTDVVESYFADMTSNDNDGDLRDAPGRSGDGRLRFCAAYLQDESGRRTQSPQAGQPVDIVLEFASGEDLKHVQFKLTIFNQTGIAVTHCNVDAYGNRPSVPAGNGRVTCHIPKLPLPYGQYSVAVAAQDDIGTIDLIASACSFGVDTSTFFPSPYMPRPGYATFLLEHTWVLASGESSAE